MVAASDSPLSLAVVSVAHFAPVASFSLMVCFERSSTLLIASALKSNTCFAFGQVVAPMETWILSDFQCCVLGSLSLEQYSGRACGDISC